MSSNSEREEWLVYNFLLDSIFGILSHRLLNEQVLLKLQAMRSVVPKLGHKVLSEELLAKVVAFHRDLILSSHPRISEVALGFLRDAIVVCPEIARIYVRVSVHTFLATVIETNKDLVMGVLALIKKWIVHSPENFPEVLCLSLKSILLTHDFPADDDDKLSVPNRIFKSSVYIVVLLSLNNRYLFLGMGGLSLVLRFIVSPQVEDDLRNNLIKIFIDSYLDEQEIRAALDDSFDLGQVFSCFHAKYLTPRGPGETRTREPYELAAEFLTRCLTSQSGLLFFRQREVYIESLIEAIRFPSANRHIQDCLIEVFQRILEVNLLRITHIQILQLDLFVACGLYKTLVGLAMINDFEAKVKTLMISFLKFCCLVVSQSYLPSNDFLMYALLPTASRVNENEGVMISRIKNMLDNNASIAVDLEHYLKTDYTVQGHSFLFACQDLYRNMKTSFSDFENSTHYVWNKFLARSHEKVISLEQVKENLRAPVEKWDMVQLEDVLERVGEGHLSVDHPLIQEIFGMVLRQVEDRKFSRLPWNPQHFIYIRCAYKMIQVSFYSVKVFEKTFRALLALFFSPAPKVAHIDFGSIGNSLMPSHSHQKNGHGRMGSSIGFSDISSSVRRQSVNMGRHAFDLADWMNDFSNDRLGTKDPVTLQEELIFLVAYCSFAPVYSPAIWESFFERVEDLVERPHTPERLIAKLLLGLSYERNDSKTLLIRTLNKGTEFLSKICVNILHFLLEFDLEIHLDFFRQNAPEIVRLYRNAISRSSAKREVLLLILKMISIDSLSEHMLNVIGVENLKNDPVLFNEFAKKERSLEVLLRNFPKILNDSFENYVGSEAYLNNYHLYRKALSSCLGNSRKERTRLPFPNFLEKYGQVTQNWAAFRALALRIPWRLRLGFTREETRHVLIFSCFTCLNTDLDALELTANTIFKDDSDELLWRGFGCDDDNWTLDVSLMIGNQDLDRQYCITAEEQPQFLAVLSQKNLPRTVKDDHFSLTLKDVVFTFHRKERRYLLKSVLTRVPLGPEKGPRKLEAENNYFSSLSASRAGANYLHESKIILAVLKEIFETKNTLKQRALILSLGFIAENPEGAQVLGRPDYRDGISRVVNEMIENQPSLHTQGVIYSFANMLCKSETGREVLTRDVRGKSSKWQIYYISKVNPNTNADNYIAVYNDKLQTVEQKQLNFPQFGLKLGELFGKIGEVSSDQKNLEKNVITVLQKLLREKETAGDIQMQFPMGTAMFSPFVLYISQQLVKSSETRKRFFTIVKDHLERLKEFVLPNEISKSNVMRSARMVRTNTRS